eukprot:jgi/Bigna1/125324/aug1.1_g32
MSNRSRMKSRMSLPGGTLDMKKINTLSKNYPEEFQSEHNFNPFKYWKENERKLKKWESSIDKIVDLILDVYTKGFNTATSSFSQILSRFGGTQRKVDNLLENLKQSRRILVTKPDSLRERHLENKRLEKILAILDKVEYVVGVPKQVEQFLARKQYLHAVQLVIHTLSLLLADDLGSFGALDDIRQHMLTQRNAIQEMLIDHLHKHIYSETEDRNDITVPASDGISTSVSNHRNSSSHNNSRPGSSFHGSMRGGGDEKDGSFTKRGGSFRNSERYFEPRGADKFSPFRDGGAGNNSTKGGNFLSYEESQQPPDNENEEEEKKILELLKEEKSDTYLGNPEGNSALLIDIVIESLSKLGRLPSCQSALRNRVHNELQHIIDAEAENLQKKSEQRLMELMNSVFQRFTSVLQNQINVWAVMRKEHEAKARREAMEKEAEDDDDNDEDEDVCFNISIINIFYGGRYLIWTYKYIGFDDGIPKAKFAPTDEKANNKSKGRRHNECKWYKKMTMVHDIKTKKTACLYYALSYLHRIVIVEPSLFVWEAMQAKLKEMLRTYWKVKKTEEAGVTLATTEEAKKESDIKGELLFDFRFEHSDIPSVAALARENPNEGRNEGGRRRHMIMYADEERKEKKGAIIH